MELSPDYYKTDIHDFVDQEYYPHTILARASTTRDDWVTNLSEQDYLAIKDTLTWPEVLQSCQVNFKTRSTGTLVSCCPFHLDKTPSAFYYPKSKRFHCYGCAQGEDIVEFVARVKFKSYIVETSDFQTFIRGLTAPLNDPRQGFLPFVHL